MIVVTVFGVEGHGGPVSIHAVRVMKGYGAQGRPLQGRQTAGINRGPCPNPQSLVAGFRRHSQPFRLKKRPVPSDDITISTRRG